MKLHLMNVIKQNREIERLGSTTYKGIGGTNLQDAFTPQIRSYDQSMVGLLSYSSPDSNKVGINDTGINI